MNPLSKEVSAKILELVVQGVLTKSEMRRHLKVYVEKILFLYKQLPKLTDSAYFPSDKVLGKHIYAAQVKLR